MSREEKNLAAKNAKNAKTEKVREAFRIMAEEQWDDYQEYLRLCGGSPISKIPAAPPADSLCSLRSLAAILPARAAASSLSNLPSSDSLAAHALAALPDLAGDALPTDIQVFPPGRGVEFTLEDYPGERFQLDVDASVAARAQAELERLLEAERQGKASAPFADKNHEDAEATFHPVKFFWAGDDPRQGGVRVQTQWTPYGAALVRAKAFKYFSGNFLFNPSTKKFLGLINENIGGLVNRPGFASQQAFAKADASTTKTTDTMTDKEIQDAITNGLTAGLKPVITRLDTLEAQARGGTAPQTQPQPGAGADADNKIITLVQTALKPLTDDVKALQEANTNTVMAAAKATVQTIGIRGGRIAAQDADTIKFWEESIAANAKAADALMKMPVNPALSTVVANAGAGGTASGTGNAGEHEFVIKARAHAEKHKIASEIDAQTEFGRTPEGQKLYREYVESLAPRK